MSDRNQDHVELGITETFKIFLYKETAEVEKMSGNLSKNSSNKSSQAPFTVAYDFETMIIEKDN